jgi:aspartate aminotransferase
MRQLTPSATGVIQAAANQMRKKGLEVYNFGTGDPILANHPAILEAAQEVIRDKMSPYAPFAGMTELRQSAADWMNRRYGARFEVKETVVCCGGKFGIYAALQILLAPGEEVLVPAPYWVSYPEMVHLANAHPIIIPASEKTKWKISAKEMVARITPKTRVILLNNACNPTGALYSRQEIADLLLAAKEAGLMVISDEVYSEIVYDGAEFVSCSSFPEHRSHVIIIESCSKNFAMAGWRVGFAFGPSEVIANMIALQSQSTSGTSLISQQAALGALRHADEVSAYVRHAMDRRRKLFFQTYNKLFQTNIPPISSTLYFFTQIGKDSMKECEKILNESRVALVPGIGFGMEGYARFAFSEEEALIEKGLQAFHQFRKKSG